MTKVKKAATVSTKIKQKNVRQTRNNIKGNPSAVKPSSKEINQKATKRTKINIKGNPNAVKPSPKEINQKATKRTKINIKENPEAFKSSRKEIKQKVAEKRGLVYIGHIPHGFYEKEMKRYFKQFGKVTNVKVCRSRVTGNCKGYGYVEFSHPEVAKIAAETMNNYVMFKKRIVTEYVPHEKRPKALFQGKSSNPQNTSVQTRRGKQKYTRNKIQDEATVAKKTGRGLKKLQSKIDKLKSLGIKCDLKPVDVCDSLKLVGK